MYSSTCVGRPHAHHQELNNCSSSLWFYLWSVVVAVLLVVVGPAGRLLMMGVRATDTCCAVHTRERQAINLRICCICLVDLLETYDDVQTCKL